MAERIASRTLSIARAIERKRRLIVAHSAITAAVALAAFGGARLPGRAPAHYEPVAQDGGPGLAPPSPGNTNVKKPPPVDETPVVETPNEIRPRLAPKATGPSVDPFSRIFAPGDPIKYFDKGTTDVAPAPGVAVDQVGGCTQPPCDITFRARLTGGRNSEASFAWSGCASGIGETATCRVNGQEAVTATVSLVIPAGDFGPIPLASATGTARMVTVFFGTNRRELPPDGRRVRFGPGRPTDGNQPLSLGVASVSIPPHHLRGRVERPMAFWKFTAHERADDHMLIFQAFRRTPDEFFGALHARVDRSEKRDAFVFVHGFRVDFDAAVLQTAQLAWDLNFQGAALMYSWPSGGTVAGYQSDYDAARIARVPFAEFLRQVAARSGAQTLYVIAHSMGAWAVVNGFEELDRGDRTVPHVKELVFAAPDVAQGEFQIAAPRMKSRADRISLYAASEDSALLASRKLRSDFPRAGEAGAHLLVVPDVETIDASAVALEALNILDHSYFASTVSVLSDIATLLQAGTPPGRRFGLEGRRLGALAYWAFIASAFPFWLIRGAEYLGLVAVAGLLLLLAAAVARWIAKRVLEHHGVTP